MVYEQTKRKSQRDANFVCKIYYLCLKFEKIKNLLRCNKLEEADNNKKIRKKLNSKLNCCYLLINANIKLFRI